MNHAEIRAIRGALSRAAFARRLGVTSLTVLRWELPEGSKEARRPRARMVETLRRLAADGVGASSPLGDEEVEDDEDDASEPIAVSAPPSAPPSSSSASDDYGADESVLLPLLDQLSTESWPAAEDELLALVASPLLRTHAGRTLAMLGLVQTQILVRVDSRGALMTLMPILDDAERGKLRPAVAARAHGLAALLFCAPDLRIFDPGRANVHAARCEELLGDADDDVKVLIAAARISATRFLSYSVALRAYDANQHYLDRAASPLSQFIAEGLRSMAAAFRGDVPAAQRHVSAGLAVGERLGLRALVQVVLADRAWRALRGAHPPEVVLHLAEDARQKALTARLAPSEAGVRLASFECEALCRLGRFQEALTLAEDASAIALREGFPRYALAMPTARLYAYLNRVSELLPWATSLESDSVGSHRGLAHVHAIQVRAFAAGLAGDYARAIELSEQVCRAAESTIGLHYVIHDAYFEIGMANVLLRDERGREEAIRRGMAFLREHPSAWHEAAFRRLQGFGLMHQGRFAEARQKFEACIATFALVGDKVQGAYDKMSLAVLARAAGAPDALARFHAARAELEQLGAAIAPELARRAEALSMPPGASAWKEPSMTERLVVAVDRLSVRGLAPSLLQRELVSVLRELMPLREVLTDAEAQAPDCEVIELADGAGGRSRVGVRGGLDAEQRAALRILATIIPLVSDAGRPSGEPELAIDDQLPAFIAAAPATRQLKSEITRLSRSSATILVTGESGSGKEVVARAVHELSGRADKPYVVFNCASVPRDLFESQLFGHRRGAFTGAASDSPGVIRAAEGGTLFLDEIGELPLDTQPKLLRFLENAEILPLGEQKPRQVDVRVLAATHRDLGRLVREGRFREDLYYRLNVVPLHVPPLRERKEDIVALARVFVGRLAPDASDPPELGSDAVQALKAHSWPGNVRELRNVIERAMAYAPVPALLRAAHLRIAPNEA